MCLKDVRMGRALSIGQRTTGTPTIAVPVQVLAMNVNRGRIVAGISAFQSGNGLAGVALRSGSATGPIIAAVSPGRPSAVLRVEELGPLLTNSVWATVTSDNSNVVDVSELVWDQPLEDV